MKQLTEQEKVQLRVLLVLNQGYDLSNGEITKLTGIGPPRLEPITKDLMARHLIIVVPLAEPGPSRWGITNVGAEWIRALLLEIGGQANQARYLPIGPSRQ
jgi:hypothetical protein